MDLEQIAKNLIFVYEGIYILLLSFLYLLARFIYFFLPYTF